jgi:hypothetical protein
MAKEYPMSYLSNCIAHYRLNDNLSDKVIQNQKDGLDGLFSVNTNLRSTLDAVLNRAIAFNGVDDFVDLQAHFQSILQNSFSMNFWYKANREEVEISSLIGVKKYVSADNVNEFCCRLRNDHGQIEAKYNIENQGINISLNMSDSDWGVYKMITYLVLKISSTQAVGKLYMDGILRANSGSQPVNMGLYENSHNIYLGATHFIEQLTDIPFEFFKGELNNVEIFNRALTSGEIIALFSEGRKLVKRAPLKSDFIFSHLLHMPMGV